MARLPIVGTTTVLVLIAFFAACGSDDTDAPPEGTGHTDAATRPETSSGPDGTRPDTSTPVDATTSDAGTDATTSDAEADADATSSDSGADDASEATDAGWDCSTLTLGSLRTAFPSQGDCDGANVAYVGCAKTATQIGCASGGWSLNVAQEKSFYRVTKAGWRTTLSQEFEGLSVGTPIGLQLVGTDLTDYDATKAHILLTISPATGGCTKNGNIVELVGHPEAVVHYVASNGADAGTSTNTEGLVWITNIDPALGATATLGVTPAVAGCSLSAGELPIVADTVTAVTKTIFK